ncbi:hypothetical protein JTE90_010914 [Oedothorax gibbosus]|uniref:Uncharacterized protein n=1 Tax=Oedothorax gibbosus TaxID=931172 RepID=A0AAV6UIG2_9ARAC|nr:hypothetical protein JTE90_010914 [Oedothorax gibbosus]
MDICHILKNFQPLFAHSCGFCYILLQFPRYGPRHDSPSVINYYSLVHEVYDELRSETRRSLVLSDALFTNEHLKFMICMDKDACLTVHKIVKKQRSFIVATFGCVIIYMLILDIILVIA